MRKFPVSIFFKNDRENWPCEDFEKFICIFDDVELVVTTPRLELSSMLWDVHKAYPKLPILSNHYIGAGPLPWSKIAGVLSNIYESVYRIYGDGKFDREAVWELLYRNVNEFYNDSVVRYKRYVRSANSFDYDELYNHPRMIEIRKALRPNPSSIQKAYDDATKFLMSDDTLKTNPVISDAKNGIAKMEQLLQVLICRGFNTDIDDHIFDQPIMGNYYEGIHDPAEALMDSTLASKALIFTGAPLEQTQYGNRKLQFSSMRVDLLVQGDCGTQRYAKIALDKVRAKGLLGMYFKDLKTSKLTELTKDLSEELLGATLEFRVPIYCAHRDKRAVCATCYGTLSRNMPYGVNLGFIASVNTQSEVSQKVLKVKHVESLTFNEPMILSPGEREFILNDKDPTKLKLNPRLAKEGILLQVRGDVKDKVINASRLPVLTKADINPQRSVAHHSQFKEVTFEIPMENDKVDRRRLTVAKGSMSAFFTAEFLRWFVDRDFRIDGDGFYRFDLSDWDFSKPFLELPKKHLSMKDFATEVEVFIRSTRDQSAKHLGKLKQLSQYHDPTEAMLDLFDLISTRVSVHMTHVSVVCLSMMYDPSDKDNLRIPPINKPGMFAKYSKILGEGSFACMSAYERGGGELRKFSQYSNQDREQHLMDPLFYN